MSDKTTIENQREKCVLSFSEEQSPGISTVMRLEAIHYQDEQKSPYQKIDVVGTCFGRTLITDGKTQSAELDEFMYHETLVHPAALVRGLISSSSGSGPETVFIGGGGELATAREVLRHKSVRRCIMVDLDGEVVRVARRHLPSWGGDAVYNDPRLELVVGDAHAYLENYDVTKPTSNDTTTTKTTFDLIIMDISDPIEAGPGIALYTQEFYRRAASLLTPGKGVFVTQAGVSDSMQWGPQDDPGFDSCLPPITKTLRTVFDCAIPYDTFIPSFQNKWGFVMAFNFADTGDTEDSTTTTSLSSDIGKQITEAPSGVVDDLIEEHIIGGNSSLRHYDGCAHRGFFGIVKALRKKIEEETRVMTMENPVFMF